MAASRSRRANAGSLMPALMKDFREEETFSTLYGGFSEELDDNDFGPEAASDDGTDTDFDEEEEALEDDIAEDHGEEDEGKRRRMKTVKKAQSGAKRKTVADRPSTPTTKKPRLLANQFPSEDTLLLSENESEGERTLGAYENDDTNSGDKDDSRGMVSGAEVDGKSKKRKPIVTPSSRSIRDSTAAKRFETEELELQRELRRQEIGPRKRTKHRIPSQTERLSKTLMTEKANRADLARYEKDEEENEKKRTRKQKVIRGPFDVCTISMTTTLPEIHEAPSEQAQQLLHEAEDLIGHRPGEKYGRSLVCFRTEELFKQAFPDQIPLTPKSAVNFCPVTGKPARYRDPVTWQYYYDSQALYTLREVIYRHLVFNPISLGNPKVMEYVEWFETRYNTNLRKNTSSDVGGYDYSVNAVGSQVNGAGPSGIVNCATPSK